MATVEGEALARVAYNALVFVPKSALNRLVRLKLSATHVEISGTDGYAGGKDSAPVHNGPGTPVEVTLTRDDLEALEATSRAWKKAALALTLTPGELVVSGGPGEPLRIEIGQHQHEAWRMVDRLFELGEQGAWATGPVAYDPALLSRFAKVKSPADRVADFLWRGPGLPVLVKVGQTFVGLVMPLDRPRAEAYSPEGLW